MVISLALLAGAVRLMRGRLVRAWQDRRMREPLPGHGLPFWATGR